ncbi:MAG: hypothetical protein GF383_15890, partial [Candidatus Lokiarchaeota archaeon]|nr:hypothetical protein [Candidatus Lokiarchaeota archaeon]MBD3343187.1 hypothetical protein [Candidatus Lokiarchaeota archaeon]
MNLKKELFKDFDSRKEEIRCGNSIPKFNDYKHLTKYKSLTKKNFREIRNQWVKTILKRKSFLRFRDEIRTIKFFKNDNDLFKEIKNETYPEGFLIHNLIKILNLTFPALEKKIYGNYYKNIPCLLERRAYFTWEGLTSKIKNFILSIQQKSLRDRTIKVFQRYITLKIFYGFQKEAIPDPFNFKINDYPEGWLIIRVCEINLITDTYLGKLIGYDDLPFHLTSHRKFKGGRIAAIKEFIATINDESKREKCYNILSRYIEYNVFRQLKTKKINNYELFLDKNPKKWLFIKLCKIFNMLLRDFGRTIDYEEIKSAIQRKYELSDVSIKKIREYIYKICDVSKKKKAIEAFRIYLKRAIYYRYKMTDLPKFKFFKSKMHPALWLVIQICSIYLIHPFELEKLIGYNELAKRLKTINYFTNITVTKFKNFIRRNGTSQQKERARNAIIRFIEVRNEEFERYTGPKIQNLNKISDYPKLVEHLK